MIFSVYHSLSNFYGEKLTKFYIFSMGSTIFFTRLIRVMRFGAVRELRVTLQQINAGKWVNDVRYMMIKVNDGQMMLR